MEKLVRDAIPKIMQAAGVEAKYRVMDEKDRLHWLIKKLHEETDELEASPNIEECADILEVFDAIIAELTFDMSEVRRVAEEKRQKRGGFSTGIILSVEGS